MLIRALLLTLALVLLQPILCLADEAASLTAELKKFTAPKLADTDAQKLRDYVGNDQRRRREAANQKSSAEWRAIQTKEQWLAFRRDKLQLLRRSLGNSLAADDWRPPQPLRVEKAGEIKGDGYRIEKVIYESRPGLWVTADLYAPEPPRAKMPGLVLSHAHHTPKENGELQDMGVLWARAGCYVLSPDHLGHGERRGHPFRTAADYDKPFQASRNDYYHRYDLNAQLTLVGESLMGYLAWDLMTGVSLLLDQPGIDREKIILLGAVAGGGDPCAVTAALDERITCAAPFNFGGPQPETRYPLPDDAETSFNYAGGGSWESTRNLAMSMHDGTLPWVIVGSIAPRRLIYGHEFAWDRERDPVWKRLEKIYGWYDQPANLSFATGYGTITAKDPPGSHCTHIGATHRKNIHASLAKWFDIQLPEGKESTDRHDAAELRCWTDELRSKLKPQPLHVLLQKAESAPSKIAADVTRVRPLRGPIEVAHFQNIKVEQFRVEQLFLNVANERTVPLLILEPVGTKAVAGTVIVISTGKNETLVQNRAAEFSQLLASGLRIALPDLYGTGLTASGSDRGRRSSATSRSSTERMLGSSFLDQQIQDLLLTIEWLQTGRGKDQPVALWSDSGIDPHPANTNFRIPRDEDGQLPRGADPLPQLVTLLTAKQRPEIAAVYIRGGLSSYRTALDSYLMLLPNDGIVPGLFPQHDLPRLAASLAPRPVRLDGLVDAWNRPSEPAATATLLNPATVAYRNSQAAPRLEVQGDPTTAAGWLVKQLSAKK
ncbi:hypothetical protein NA78x_006182 [Anatilimnocola sp. NA78]|uniref:hypothetical protein n=1 Tax=Anatilimnocola sp. NA78 TaxID=3415683 RepID=UPI003CE49E07